MEVYCFLSTTENDIDQARQLAKDNNIKFNTVYSGRFDHEQYDNSYKPTNPEFCFTKLAQLMKVLKPQCVPNGIREFAYSATGYIVPCCICDNAHHHDKKNDPLHNNLFKEHLHLDNAESLDDIFLSRNG